MVSSYYYTTLQTNKTICLFQLITLLLLTLLTTFLCSYTNAQITPSPGKCLPFPKFNGDVLSGYQSSVCATILQQSGYTSFWASESDVPSPLNPALFDSSTPLIDTQCGIETFYNYEAPAQRLLNSFSIGMSTTCQNVLMVNSCMYYIPICDPEVDTTSYITQAQHRPCSWICDIFDDQHLGDFCNQRDVEILKNVNFDLTLIGSPAFDVATKPYLAPFQCNSDRYVQPVVPTPTPMILDEDGMMSVKMNSSNHDNHHNKNDNNEQIINEQDQDSTNHISFFQSTALSSDGYDNCIAPQWISAEPLVSRCEKYIGTICGSVFPGSTRVYIPGGMNQAMMEETLSTQLMVLNALPVRSVSQCAEELTRISCQAVFRECVDHGVSLHKRDANGLPGDAVKNPDLLTKALALNPPYDSCAGFVESCNDTEFYKFYRNIKGIGNVITDCDNASQYNHAMCIGSSRESTPSASSSYSFNSKNYFKKTQYGETMFDASDGSIFVANSYGASQTNTVQYLPYSDRCPSPLVVADEGTNAKNTVFGATDFPTRCALPCPSPAYTAYDRFYIERAAWIFIMVSLFTSGLLLVTYTVFASQRSKHLVWWYIFTYFCVVFVLFLGLIVRPNNSFWDKQCSGPSEYQHMQGFGLFQGIILIYFLCSSTSWWLMQAVDMYQRLILGFNYHRQSFAEKQRRTAMHLFCWINPCFVVGACLYAHQIGYDGHLPFAFINHNESTGGEITSKLSMIIIFFIQILFSIIIGLVLIGIVLVYLWKYSATDGLKKVHEQMEEKNTTKLHKAKVMLKLFGFVILVIPFFVLLIVFFSTRSFNESVWIESSRQWGRDLLLNLNGYNIFTGDEIKPISEKMSLVIIILTTFAFCSQGFMMFILHFLLSSQVYGLWFGIFFYKCGWKCCGRWAIADIDTGSAKSDLSNDSSNTTHNSTNPSVQTNTTNQDIFSSGVVLNQRGRSNTHVNNTTTNISNNNANINPNNTTSSSSSQPTTVPPTPNATSSRKPEARKGALFKGMTKGSNDYKQNKNYREGGLEMSDYHQRLDGEMANDSFQGRISSQPVQFTLPSQSPGDETVYQIDDVNN